jgi:hypothetical protein
MPNWADYEISPATHPTQTVFIPGYRVYTASYGAVNQVSLEKCLEKVRNQAIPESVIQQILQQYDGQRAIKIMAVDMNGGSTNGLTLQ